MTPEDEADLETILATLTDKVLRLERELAERRPTGHATQPSSRLLPIGFAAARTNQIVIAR